MAEESEASYTEAFRKLKERGMRTPKLVISDAHSGLASAVRRELPDASWQRCKVRFMRNILARVPAERQRRLCCGAQKNMAGPNEEEARHSAEKFIAKYENKYPKAIKSLEDSLNDSPTYHAFPRLEAKKYPHNQHVGTAGHGDKAKDENNWDIPKRRIVHMASCHAPN